DLDIEAAHSCRRQDTFGRAAGTHLRMDAGADDGRRNAGREIAVTNQPDAGSGGADVADQLLVPRSIQHDDHEVLDLTTETSGNRFKVVGRRRVQVDGVLR